MNCDEFKKNINLEKVTLCELEKNDDFYDAWIEHIYKCRECMDLFMKTSLEKKNEKIENFPCIHIAYYSQVERPPIKKIKKKYGILKDSLDIYGPYYVIDYCPWCGKKLYDKI